MTYKAPRLSSTELALLSELDRRQQTRITTNEAKDIVGATGTKVVADLARKGALDRVGHGVYVVRPLRAVGRRWSVSAFTAVAQALSEKRYYIGGPAALTLHRLTEQMHISVVDVFLGERRLPQILANARVRFHNLPVAQLEDGLAPVLIEQVPVSVSDPERTLVDALNHPSAFGGVAQGVRAVERALPKVNLDRVVTYALKLSGSSSLQRLGVLMERQRAPESLLARLEGGIRNTRNLPAMIPGPRKGPFNPRWHISENDKTVSASGSSSPT
jgi:predicted transcriptional regulator of viral defense system